MVVISNYLGGSEKGRGPGQLALGRALCRRAGSARPGGLLFAVGSCSDAVRVFEAPPDSAAALMLGAPVGARAPDEPAPSGRSPGAWPP